MFVDFCLLDLRLHTWGTSLVLVLAMLFTLGWYSSILSNQSLTFLVCCSHSMSMGLGPGGHVRAFNLKHDGVMWVLGPGEALWGGCVHPWY